MGSPGVEGGSRQKERLRAAPRPGPRHTPRGIGEEKGPLAGGQLHSHTHPPPPPYTPACCPRPPPLPCVPGSRARLHLSPVQSTPSFSTKQHYAPPPAPAPGGIRGNAQPATSRAPRPLPRPLRSRSPSPGRTPLGREMEPSSAASSTLRRHPSPSARSDRRGTHGARGASRVNRFGAGVDRDARVGSWGPRCGHSPGCALAANASSGWGFFCRRSRRGWKPLSSSWCPWPRFP